MSYQRIEFVSNGTTLASSVNRLSIGSGLIGTTSSNTLAVTLDANAVMAIAGTGTATSYQQTFAYANLDANGFITATHNLGSDFPIVQVYSNGREIVLPDSIVSLDSNNVRVEMHSYGNIIGNWTISIRK